MTVAILFGLILGAVGYLAAYVNTLTVEYLVISLSFVIIVPFAVTATFDSRKDLFSVNNTLLYFLLMSSPIFCVYVFHFANEDKYNLAMYWLDFSQLMGGQMLLFIGTLAMFAGIIAMRFAAAPQAESSAERAFSATRMRYLAFAAIAVGVLSVYAYMLDTNITLETLAEGVSKKRVHEETISDSAPRGSALTHWRFLGGTLPQTVAIAYLVLIWTKKFVPERLDYGLIAALVLISLPFRSSPARGRRSSKSH